MGIPASERTHKKNVEAASLRGGPKPRSTHERRQERRDRAANRAADRAKRTDAEQLTLLEQRGYPNCREAKRLRERMTAKPVVATEE